VDAKGEMTMRKWANTLRGRVHGQNGGSKQEKSTGGMAMNELRSQEIQRLRSFAEIRVI
jgi:hypothetical protein